MNEKLKDAFDNIYDARLPNIWKRNSWDSSTLGFWFTELLERDKQFRTWCFEVINKNENILHNKSNHSNCNTINLIIKLNYNL